MKDRFAPLKSYLDTVPELGVTGVDCIVYKNHQEIFRHAAGYGDLDNRQPLAPNALYNIYSATKMITCVAALQLLEEGRILLSDPLEQFLPEFGAMQVKTGSFAIGPAERPIRLSHLFTMTAGLGYEIDRPVMRKFLADTEKDFNSREFVRALAQEPLRFQPGASWNYSLCHDVLGVVIEEVSGLPLGAYFRQHIFEPLGMQDTAFRVPAEKRGRIAPQYKYLPESHSAVRITSDSLGTIGSRQESGGGGLVSTVSDYILFLDALACGGMGRSGARILAANTIDLMRRNHLDTNCLQAARNMFGDGIGYGLGVGMVVDAVGAGTLAPEGAFYWGGMGGVQNLVDPANRLCYMLAQHLIESPKDLIQPKIRNILYSRL